MDHNFIISDAALLVKLGHDEMVDECPLCNTAVGNFLLCNGQSTSAKL